MRALASSSCDLIYVDPPFDLNGVRWSGSTGPRGTSSSACQHRQQSCESPGQAPLSSLLSTGGRSRGRRATKTERALDSFLAFLHPRLVRMHQLLSERGSLYVHLDWRTVHHVKVLLDELFGPDGFLNEIIWSYRSGGRCGRWFPRKHDTLLLYAKNPGRHTFNRLRDGAYRTRDLRVTSDGRPYKSTKAGPIYFDPAGPMVPDVWDIPFLSTVADERADYPNQKPETLLERVISASSNEGDLVADFFCGSGTTLAVAKRLNRRYLGCDVNPSAVAITRRRLTAVPKRSAT